MEWRLGLFSLWVPVAAAVSAATGVVLRLLNKPMAKELVLGVSVGAGKQRGGKRERARGWWWTMAGQTHEGRTLIVLQTALTWSVCNSSN